MALQRCSQPYGGPVGKMKEGRGQGYVLGACVRVAIRVGLCRVRCGLASGAASDAAPHAAGPGACNNSLPNYFTARA